MAKRFTDTDKWKKPFIRSLTLTEKLLWFYILDDCDIAGLWQVDFEVAEIRIGSKLDKKAIMKSFGDAIIEIDNGEKWFIPSFIEFQYGSQLSKTNNIFKSIDKILTRYDLYKFLEIQITETGTTISSYRNRISQKVRDKIFLDAEFVCQYCSEQKSKNELVVDHFIPLNKKGDNSDDNLVCSCIRCNSAKTDILPDIFIEKGLPFINPTEKLKLLIGAYKKLNAASNNLLGAKDKDKDKDMEMVKELDTDKELKVEKTKLELTFDAFLEMRKKIKKPPTEHAIKLLKEDLEKLSKGNEQMKIAILEQSIKNSYQGVFPLKQTEQPSQTLTNSGRYKKYDD